MAKIYTLSYSRHGVEHTASGTLEELRERYSYRLECGNSWNGKIPRFPKSINALVNAINRSIDETCGGFDRPYVSLVQ